MSDLAGAIRLNIERVAIRQFTAPAPDDKWYPDRMWPFVSREAVRGWLVGVTDGMRWGWWGPVPVNVARWSVRLFSRLADQAKSAAATPGEWAQRLRLARRHAHTGLLGTAVGAFELACWDLAGHRAELPVWALSASDASSTAAATYATCFGVDPFDEDVAGIAVSVSSTWHVQKWHPGRWGLPLSVVNRLAAAAGGDDRLAIDFHGVWPPEEVTKLSRCADARLMWVEEPYAPYELFRAVPGEFGTRHAAGEHCYGPFEGAALYAAGVDVWQPDGVFCGGYESLRTLLAMAQTHGALSAPHGGGFLAALHAAAAGSPVWLLEYHILLEPRRQAHLAAPQTPLFYDGSGLVPPPNEPGWGGPLHPALHGGHGA